MNKFTNHHPYNDSWLLARISCDLSEWPVRDTQAHPVVGGSADLARSGEECTAQCGCTSRALALSCGKYDLFAASDVAARYPRDASVDCGSLGTIVPVRLPTIIRVLAPPGMGKSSVIRLLNRCGAPVARRGSADTAYGFSVLDAETCGASRGERADNASKIIRTWMHWARPNSVLVVGSADLSTDELLSVPVHQRRPIVCRSVRIWAPENIYRPRLAERDAREKRSPQEDWYQGFTEQCVRKVCEPDNGGYAVALATEDVATTAARVIRAGLRARAHHEGEFRRRVPLDRCINRGVPGFYFSAPEGEDLW